MKWFLFTGLIVLSSLLAPVAVHDKAGIQGSVVRVIDGDTFELLTKQKQKIRVRMNGIDCPERKQDFYQAAKDALAYFIFKKEVSLNVTGYDRNQRMIALVFCDQRNINLAMVRSGFAWHYKKYSTDTSFANAERRAREEKKGLWQMNKPMPPWEFRKKREPSN